jgi:hypothetical protein
VCIEIAVVDWAQSVREEALIEYRRDQELARKEEAREARRAAQQTQQQQQQQPQAAAA